MGERLTQEELIGLCETAGEAAALLERDCGDPGHNQAELIRMLVLAIASVRAAEAAADARWIAALAEGLKNMGVSVSVCGGEMVVDDLPGLLEDVAAVFRLEKQDAEAATRREVVDEMLARGGHPLSEAVLAAFRRETLQTCIKAANDADPGESRVPAKSRRTWAGNNYMSGWRQAQSGIVRALRDLEDPNADK